MHILANDGIDAEGVQLLTEAGFTVSTEKVAQEELADAINSNNISALLVRSATKVRKELIDACPGLKLIGRGGVGMDNIDVAYAREKGIHVINTPAASSTSVAELVFAHLLDLSRFLYDSNRFMPNDGGTAFKDLKKKYGKGLELRGKTIGILGFGRIGQAVACYGLGLGMKVKAFDLSPGKRTIHLDVDGTSGLDVVVETVSMEEVLKESDFITLHIPAQSDNKPVISTDEFSKMKDGVIIVNAARGGVLDESALIQAIDSFKVRCAGLDVFENEPTPDNRLLNHPRISLTPHIGAATLEAQTRISIELAEQIKNLLKSGQ